MREIFNTNCTDCQSTNIIYDEYKGELFCIDCGLILASKFEIIKITDYIKENNKKQSYI